MADLPLRYVALSATDVGVFRTFLDKGLGIRSRDLEGGGILATVGATDLVVLPTGHHFLASPDASGVDHLGIAETGLPVGEGDAAGLTMSADDIRGSGVHGRLAQIGAIARLTTHSAGASTSAETAKVERLDHVGIASADNVPAIELLCRQYGFSLESNQFDVELRVPLETFTSDKYGIVHHGRPPERAGGLRVTFITVGDCELEFLQDLGGDGSDRVDPTRAGNTKGDQSAIARYVERHGPRPHHLAFKTNDIDALLHHLDGEGFRLIDRVGRPGSRQARIGFVHPSATAGILVHLVERVPIP